MNTINTWDANILWYIQIDEQLASGEFFLSQKKKSAKKWQEKQEKQTQKTAENKRKREAAFVPPEVVYCEANYFNRLQFIDILIHAVLRDVIF